MGLMTNIAMLLLLAIAAFFLWQYLALPPSPLPQVAPGSQAIRWGTPEILPAPPLLLPPSSWRQINKQDAARACLLEFRRRAEAKGFESRSVFSCSCIAQESLLRKDYSCRVWSFEGGTSASIMCGRASGTCTLSSKDGLFTFTHSQFLAAASP